MRPFSKINRFLVIFLSFLLALISQPVFSLATCSSGHGGNTSGQVEGIIVLLSIAGHKAHEGGSSSAAGGGGTGGSGEGSSYSYLGPGKFCGGSGTEEDPYLICDFQSLKDINSFMQDHCSYMDGMYVCDDNYFFKVVADIDQGGEEFSGIAKFVGSFDGGNHTLSLHVTKTKTEVAGGLFDIIFPGTVIKNLKLEITLDYTYIDLSGMAQNSPSSFFSRLARLFLPTNAYANGIYYTISDLYVGGLFGKAEVSFYDSPSIEIDNVSVKGDINLHLSLYPPSHVVYDCFTGGIGGEVFTFNHTEGEDKKVYIKHSYSKADISVVYDYSPSVLHVGGIAGAAIHSFFQEVGSSISVSLSHTSNYFQGTDFYYVIGGIIGDGEEYTLEKSYSIITEASIPDFSQLQAPLVIGGLVGFSGAGEISECYSGSRVVLPNTDEYIGAGGVIGATNYHTSISLVSVYWDKDYEGDKAIFMDFHSNTTKISVAPLTHSQMLQQSSYVGFDFSNTWYPPNGDYPDLRHLPKWKED